MMGGMQPGLGMMGNMPGQSMMGGMGQMPGPGQMEADVAQLFPHVAGDALDREDQSRLVLGFGVLDFFSVSGGHSYKVVHHLLLANFVSGGPFSFLLLLLFSEGHFGLFSLFGPGSWSNRT